MDSIYRLSLSTACAILTCGLDLPIIFTCAVILSHEAGEQGPEFAAGDEQNGEAGDRLKLHDCVKLHASVPHGALNNAYVVRTSRVKLDPHQY
jgi:hypothetical protein